MAQDKRVAIYPGTFDPLTNGHANIIRRGLRMFDAVIVAVAADTGKSPLFSLEERVAMAEKVFAKEPNISVEPFQGLLVEYVARRNVHTILRGLRAVSDFEYEFQIALMNRKLRPDIETLFLISDYRWSGDWCRSTCSPAFGISTAFRTETSSRFPRRPFPIWRSFPDWSNLRRQLKRIQAYDETARRLPCRSYRRWKVRSGASACRTFRRRNHQCGFSSSLPGVSSHYSAAVRRGAVSLSASTVRILGH